MKKKVSFIIFLVMVILVLNTNFAFGYETYLNFDGKNRESIVIKFFNDWMEKFKSDEVPERERVLSWQISSSSQIESTNQKIRETIEFSVTPVSDNTVWKKLNYVVIELKSSDGKNYEIEYIGQEPKNYDEFEEKFEEWKKDYSEEEIKETNIISTETNNFYSNEEIVKLSNTIKIGCSFIVIIIIGIVFFKIFKRK